MAKKEAEAFAQTHSPMQCPLLATVDVQNRVERGDMQVGQTNRGQPDMHRHMIHFKTTCLSLLMPESLLEQVTCRMARQTGAKDAQTHDPLQDPLFVAVDAQKRVGVGGMQNGQTNRGQRCTDTWSTSRPMACSC